MPKSSEDKTQDQDEARFNDTLKRMLQTPPKPHDEKPKVAAPKRDKGSKDDPTAP